MEPIHADGCTCSDLAEDGHYRDCRELADGPPFSCVHRMARYGKVITAPCRCTTGHSWHFNGTCLRCNQWVKDTLLLVETYPYYLKAMGTRCYDKGGITFPKLGYGRRVHRFVDERLPGAKATSQFTETNGRFNVDRALVLMGIDGSTWACPWPNMPEMKFFRRIVDRKGDDIGEVCDEAGSALYELGLIIRPSKDWIPDE